MRAFLVELRCSILYEGHAEPTSGQPRNVSPRIRGVCLPRSELLLRVLSEPELPLDLIDLLDDLELQPVFQCGNLGVSRSLELQKQISAQSSRRPNLGQAMTDPLLVELPLVAWNLALSPLGLKRGQVDTLLLELVGLVLRRLLEAFQRLVKLLTIRGLRRCAESDVVSGHDARPTAGKGVAKRTALWVAVSMVARFFMVLSTLRLSSLSSLSTFLPWRVKSLEKESKGSAASVIKLDEALHAR